jgi:DNA-binding MarR family transcriptional regulator
MNRMKRAKGVTTYAVGDQDCGKLLASVEDLQDWFAERREQPLKRAGITTEEYEFLRKAAEHKDAILQRLADIFRISDSQAGRVFAVLQEKGWVSIERGEKDHRKKIIQVTEGGEEMLAASKRQLESLIRGLLARVRKREQNKIIRAFARLNPLTGQQDLPSDEEAGRQLRKARRRRKAKGAVTGGSASVCTGAT